MESYYEDGIATLNVILGRGLDSYGKKLFRQSPGTDPLTPNPTAYEGIPFISGFGDVWGMFQGYVGVLLAYNIGICFGSCNRSAKMSRSVMRTIDTYRIKQNNKS